MAFILPPHPNTRPRVDGRAPDNAGDRAFVAAWLAHVAAGRIGGRSPWRPTAALLEAGGRPTAPLLEAAVGPTAALHEAGGRPTGSASGCVSQPLLEAGSPCRPAAALL